MAVTFYDLDGKPITEESAQKPAVGLPPPRSALGEVGTAFHRGAQLGTRQIFGQALKAVGLERAGESQLRTAQWLEENKPESVTLRPEQHGAVTNFFAGGAEHLAPSLVPLLMAPVTGGTGAAVAAGGLFGAAQYQDTKENILAAGGSEEDARTGGLVNAAIEGTGEALGTKLILKALAPAARAFAGRTPASAFKAVRDPKFLKPFMANYAKVMGTEVATEMGQGFGEAAVEQSYGVNTDPVSAMWQGGKTAAAMTTLLAPFGGGHLWMSNKQREKEIAVLENPEAPAGNRMRAAMRVGKELEAAAPKGMDQAEWKAQVMEWRTNALEAVNNQQAVEIAPLFRMQLPQGEVTESTDPAVFEENFMPPQGEVTEVNDPAVFDANFGVPLAAQAPALPAAGPAPRAAAIDRMRPPRDTGLPEVEGLPGAPLLPENNTSAPLPEIISEEQPGVPTLPAAGRRAPFNFAGAAPIAQAPGGGAPVVPGLSFADTFAASGKEARVKTLRQTLSGAPAAVVNDLAASTPEELANRIAAVWEAKGGFSASAAYVEKLGDLYKTLTGKELTDATRTQVDQGAQPQPATVQVGAGTAAPIGAAAPAAGAVATQPNVQETQATPTVADIHALAESKGIPWDNDAAFMARTKAVTGKEHLDDLTAAERIALAANIQGEQNAVQVQGAGAQTVRNEPQGGQGVRPQDTVAQVASQQDGQGAAPAAVQGQVGASRYRPAQFEDYDSALTDLRDLEKAEAKKERLTKGEQARLVEARNEVAAYRKKPGFAAAYKQWLKDHDLDTLLTGAAHPAVTKALETAKTLGEVMDAVSKVHPRLRPIAMALKNLVGDTPVVVSPVENERGSAGSFDPSTGVLTVYPRGKTPYVVLHEGVHAAVEQQVRRAEELLVSGKAPRTAVERRIVDAYKELESVYAVAKKFDPDKLQYGMTNMQEFVAELFSNPDFQSWLKTTMIEGKSAWQRILDILKALLGIRTSVNAEFEQLMEAAGPLFQPRGTVTNEVASTAAFDTPAAAIESTDKTLTKLAKATDKFAEKLRVKSLGDMGPKLRRGLLAVESRFHIKQRLHKDKVLAPLLGGTKLMDEADTAATTLLYKLRTEGNDYLQTLQNYMRKFSGMDFKKFDERMGTVADEMSRLGVDFNKTFDENVADGAQLDKDYRQEYNRLRSMYLSDSFKEGRKFITQGAKLNKDNLLRDVAVKTRNLIGQYARDNPHSMPAHLLDALDIMKVSPDTIPKALEDLQAFARTNLKGTYVMDTMNVVMEYYRKNKNNPYFHLGRSGKYYLEFKMKRDPNALVAVNRALEGYGKVIGMPSARSGTGVFMRFETESQMLAARTALQKIEAEHLEKDHEQSTIRGGHIERWDALGTGGEVQRFVRRVLPNLDAMFIGMPAAQRKQAQDFLVQQMLEMLPETSARKAMIHRKGVPGYDASFLNNFAKRSEGMSSSIASGYATPIYDHAFNVMRNEIDAIRATDTKAAVIGDEVVNELGTRFANSLHPVDSPAIDRFRAFAHAYFLSTNVAYVMMNMTQPWMLGLPFLGSRFGFVESAKVLGTSTGSTVKLLKATLEDAYAQGGVVGTLDAKLLADKSGLPKDEAALVQNLIETGVLSYTLSHEAGRLSRGEDPAWSTASKALSAFSHYSELLNRVGVGLAAYRLMKNKKPGATQDELYEFSHRAIQETQFDYSQHNAPSALGRHGVLGPVTPLFTQFQSFSFFTMEFLARHAMDSVARIDPNASPEAQAKAREERAIARKALIGTLGMTSVLAGTLGLPFANVVVAVIDALAGDDDDPADSKAAYRRFLADALGEDVAEIIARGAPRAAGIDLSSRVGLQDLLPGSRFLTDRRAVKDQIEAGAMNMLGPAVSATASIYEGAAKISDGQLLDGMIAMLPAALKGPARATQLANKGYTTPGGQPLPVEFDSWDVFKTGLGLNPSEKAEQQEVSAAFRVRDQLLKRRATTLRANVIRAIEAQDEDAAEDAMREIAQFNMVNPMYAIKDIPGTLRRRARASEVAAVSSSGVPTSARLAPLLEDYRYGNIPINR